MSVRTRTIDTRAVILDAVDRLLAQYGYQKMTLDDIVREAGVARGTLYAHFKSKEEMALATIDRLIGLLVEELRQLAHAPEPPAERLQRMLVFRILFLFDHAQERAHTLDAMYAALRPQYKAYRDRYVHSEAEVFAEVLREGQESGTFELDDPFETAHDFIFATSTLTPFSLSVRELGERAWAERKIRRIAALLIRGITRTAGASG
jgi:AcrR family transcriptional regulator